MAERFNLVRRIDEKVTDDDVARKYLSLRKGAEERGLEFNMSLKRVRQVLTTKKCAITGERIHRYIGKTPANTPANSLSFDRLDSSVGYVDDNVIAVSHKINQLKANLSLAQILTLYTGITKYQQRKEKRRKKNA